MVNIFGIHAEKASKFPAAEGDKDVIPPGKVSIMDNYDTLMPL